MRTIIIENEQDASELLNNIIHQYIPEIEVLNIATSVKEGIDAILSLEPDLIFLDIDLGDGSGFDILEATRDLDFKVIFTTAYDEYALKAFKYNTVHYLLKPYSLNDLQEAISKIKDSRNAKENLENLIQKYFVDKPKKVAFNTSEGIWMVDQDEVVRLESDGSYTFLHLRDRDKILISKPIGELEPKLSIGKFYRVHRSHIVNIDFIDKYVREDGGYVLLINGDIVPVSRYKKDAFINFLTGGSS